MMTISAPQAHGSELALSRRGSGQLPYLPGLDGIRALALCAVLLFHLPARLLPGGFLGVDVFFVLSGFLITSLLVEELDRQGRADFRRFYLRRARRLLPGLLTVLLATSVMVPVLAPDAAAAFRQDLISAVTYTTNWWYVLDGRGYFEVMGRPPLLQHLWSLGVEEQFYLVWPALLLLAWHRAGHRGVLGVALVGATASSLWMMTLASGVDAGTTDAYARVYFGTDTHATPVLLGAALAVVWRPSRLPRSIPASAQITLTLVGLGSVALLLGAFLGLGEGSAWLYRGGFQAVALAAGLLTAVASHPGARFGAMLGAQPMRWLGTRSYGLYLWHWPIFLVTRPDLDLPYRGFLAAATSLALTGAAAEASFRWIEMPIRRGGLSGLWTRGSAPRGYSVARWAAVAVVSLTVVVAGESLVTTPAVSAADYLGGVTSVGDGELLPATRLASRQRVGAATQHRRGGRDRAEQLSATPRPQARSVIAVGDSVLLGARWAVERELPRVTIDAAVARQPYETLARVRERVRADSLGQNLVLQTGTNGIPSLEDLRLLLHQLSSLRRVVVVNVHSPVPWMDQSNDVLSRAAAGMKNVVLIDWAAMSVGHREYFAADGTHLSTIGAKEYAEAINQGLTTPLPR